MTAPVGHIKANLNEFSGGCKVAASARPTYGDMVERLMASVSKAEVPNGTGGSNPSISARVRTTYPVRTLGTDVGDCGGMGK